MGVQIYEWGWSKSLIKLLQTVNNYNNRKNAKIINYTKKERGNCFLWFYQVRKLNQIKAMNEDSRIKILNNIFGFFFENDYKKKCFLCFFLIYKKNKMGVWIF